MIRVTCHSPACGRIFDADDADARSELSCPSCGTTTTLDGHGGHNKYELRDLMQGATTVVTKPSTTSTEKPNLRLACPHCQARLNVRPDAVGKAANCPKCGAKIVLRRANDGPRPAPAPPPVSPPLERIPDELPVLAPAAPPPRADPLIALPVDDASLPPDLTAASVIAVEPPRRESEEQARRAVEGQERREEIAARQTAEEQARLEAAAQARRDAEAAERREREEQARREAEEAVRREAEENERREQEERAQREAEEHARRAAEELAVQRQLEENARAEAEAQALYEAEEQARHEARLRARQRSEEVDAASADDRKYLAELSASRRAAYDRWQAATGAERHAAFVEFEGLERRRLAAERRTLEQRRTGRPGGKNAAERLRLGERLEDFLLEPVEVTPLKARLSTAVGLSNPFRILNVPAFATKASLQAQLQGEARAAASARLAATPTNDLLEFAISPQKLKGAVDLRLLDQPAARLVLEAFWFHLPEPQFHAFSKLGCSCSAEALQMLAESAVHSSANIAIPAGHGLAVAWLQAAVAREAAFAAGLVTNALGYWEVALEHWRWVSTNETLWKYFTHRGQALGLHGNEVARLRRELPDYLGAILARFARSYGRRGEAVACHRLVSILRRSLPSSRASEAGSVAAVRAGFY